MRLVKWTDKNGYRRQSLLRDGDPDSEAQSGIPQDPPDLSQLDWAAIAKEMHNLFIDRGLITWNDVQASHNGVSAVIQTVLKRRIVELFKLQEAE